MEYVTQIMPADKQYSNEYITFDFYFTLDRSG